MCSDFWECAGHNTQIADLWQNDIVEVAVQSSLLCKDIVARRGVEDAKGPVERRVGAEGEGEVVLPQEGLQGRARAREELQSHGRPWWTNKKTPIKVNYENVSQNLQDIKYPVQK